jgi:hypothetical protein
VNRPKWTEVLSDLPELALSMPPSEFIRYCEGLMYRRWGPPPRKPILLASRDPKYWDRNLVWLTIIDIAAEGWGLDRWQRPDDFPAVSQKWAAKLAEDLHYEKLARVRNTQRGSRCGQPPSRRSTLQDHTIELPCSCMDVLNVPIAMDPSGNTYPEGQDVIWAVKYLHLLYYCPTMLPEDPVTPDLTRRAELIAHDPLGYQVWRKDQALKKRGR